MKRKYAAIVLGLTMTLTTANISAVNIMAATASTAEEKQTKSEDSDSSQSEKEEKPLTERNRMVNRLKSRKGRSRMADRELRESRAMVWKAMRR